MEKNSKGSILTPILLSAALVLGVVIGLFAGRNSVDIIGITGLPENIVMDSVNTK